jgi:hypothetical protein
LSRERWNRAKRRLDDGDVVQTKLSLAEMNALLDKWQGRTGEPEMEAALAEWREIADAIAAALEAKYSEALGAAIDARLDWLREQALFKAGIEFINVLKLAPEVLRPKLRDVFREYQGYEFDAERFYRESEASLDERERASGAVLAALEVDWPERFDDELRAGLHAATLSR